MQVRWEQKIELTRDAGPCGEIIVLRTDVIPSKSWLEAYTLRELNGSGTVVRRWRVPIDHYPVGLEEDSVVLAYSSEPD